MHTVLRHIFAGRSRWSAAFNAEKCVNPTCQTRFGLLERPQKCHRLANWLFRPHHIHSVMLPIATDGVFVYRGLCVGWSRSWALQKRLNRSWCQLEVGSRRPKEPCRNQIEIPMGKGNFGGCPAHWKIFGVSAMALHTAKQVSAAADRFAWRGASCPPCCTQMSTVSVINWWPTTVISLSHRQST